MPGVVLYVRISIIISTTSVRAVAAVRLLLEPVRLHYSRGNFYSDHALFDGPNRYSHIALAGGVSCLTRKQWTRGASQNRGKPKAVSELPWPDERSRGVVLLGRKPRNVLSLRSTAIAKLPVPESCDQSRGSVAQTGHVQV